MAEYGREHRDAKKERIEQLGEGKCEITGEKKDLEGHHNSPKLFSGPDFASNYIILTKDFHSYLHTICNVHNNELIGKRLHLANKINKEPTSPHFEYTKKALDKIDDELMREYISNQIMHIQGDVRDKLLEISLLSCYKTIRDLSIKNRQLEHELKKEKESKYFRKK